MSRRLPVTPVGVRPALVLVLVLLGVGACGGGDAQGACENVVDAYARAWSRCPNHGTYDTQKANFSNALQCSQAKAFDAGKVDQCVKALDALDCGSVDSGTSPAVCDSGTLSQ